MQLITDGTIKDSTVLILEEEAGRQQILDGIKTKDWLLYTSDKLGRMVLDTKENFIEGMGEHFEGDHIATAQEVRKAEEHLNNHTRTFVRMFNIGDSAGQCRRCSRALISNHVTIIVLQGYCKNHKHNREGNPVLGPKLRLLCAANKAPNATIGNLVA